MVGPRSSELRLRILSGIALVVLALAAAWAGGWLFALLWSAAGIAIVSEWIAVTGAEPRIALSLVAAIGLVALGIAGTLGLASYVLAAIVAVTLAVSALIARSGTARLWSLAGFCYAAVAVVVPIVIRGRADLGVAVILWMFAIVWTTDIVAFFVGRRLGGPKLWPSVSPNKTWSGFAGGLVAATVAGTGWAMLTFDQPRPAVIAVIALFSAMASVAGQFGDLGESSLKRHFGVKDTGRLIPGHGGVMDRLDGFVAVAFLVGLALAGSRLVEH